MSGKLQIDLLAALVTAFSNCFDTQTCVEALEDGGRIRRGGREWQEACENDYSDRRGNGGLDDSLTRCSPGDPGADEHFALCVRRQRRNSPRRGRGHPI